MKKVFFQIKALMNSLMLPWRTLAIQWPTIKYLWEKKGLRAAYNFIFVKLFVRGEDCGISIQDPLWKRFPWLAPFPWMFEIEVTTFCNLKCVMCEHTHWAKTEPSLNKNLPFHNFKNIIDQVPHLKWINVTGEGSSFINPDFMKMLEYLKSRDIFVVFVDLFYHMNEEKMRRLIEIGIDRIWVSFDAATEKTYNDIRVGGDFKKSLNNIKRFIELKKELNSPIPEICFRYTFMQTNHHEMHDFIDLVADNFDKDWLGNYTMVEFVSLLEFEKTNHLIYEPGPEEGARLREHGCKRGIDARLSHPSHIPERKRPMDQCVAWSEPYIMIGGDLVSCCAIMMSNNRDFLIKNKFGNVLETPFREIWGTRRYKTFRSMVPRKKGKIPIFCKGCRAFNTLTREEEYGVFEDI